jgi:FkbM family methyltransferase
MQKTYLTEYFKLFKSIKTKIIKFWLFRKHLTLVLMVKKKIKNWPVYFFDQKKLIKDKYIIFYFKNGQKIKARAGTIDGVIIYENFICNVYTPEGFEIKEKDVVIDIGAHIGIFSIFASKFASKIYSFEPNDDSFAIFKENIEINKVKNIYPFKMAVSNRTGEKELFINKDNSGNNSFYLKNGSLKLTVPTISLEDFIDSNGISKIDFLKMDCEGGEYDIIFNCPRRILDMIEKISMECHDINSDWNAAALRKFLENNGFIVNIQLNTYAGSPYFFAKNKKMF